MQEPMVVDMSELQRDMKKSQAAASLFCAIVLRWRTAGLVWPVVAVRLICCEPRDFPSKAVSSDFRMVLSEIGKIQQALHLDFVWRPAQNHVICAERENVLIY